MQFIKTEKYEVEAILNPRNNDKGLKDIELDMEIWRMIEYIDDNCSN